MYELSIRIASAGDMSLERRTALQVIAELNEAYKGRLALAPTTAPRDAAAVLLALAWSEPSESLEEALTAGPAADGPGDRLLFEKTARVPLDLADRAAVMAKLEARARLDALLQAARASFTVVPFEDGELWSALERQLRRIADRTLGEEPEAVSMRPRLEGMYVGRPRLLDWLPDAPGHVVHLEAPYGYGKSVLAAQWAGQLEADGWRVLWLAISPDEPDLRALLSAALHTPRDTPDALVRELLWSAPTLLVIEDLSGEEDLALVLEDVQGLVLLASRDPLGDEALAAIAGEGGVTHLGTRELAFSGEEAIRLAGDEALAGTLHAETLGWPLPLHVASLTGSHPDPASLLAGIRASLGAPEWHELLFLAALPYLPRAAAHPETLRLASKGFVQVLESSYRLHPYIADVAFRAHAAAIAEVVARDAERLPLLLQGDAFERVGDYERLAGVLARTDAELWRQAPARVVRWDEAVTGLMTPRRHWTVGAAQQRLGNFEAAIQRLSTALDTPDLSADEQLGLMRELCLPLAVLDNARGRALMERAEPLLDAADPEVAARFLGNAAIIHAHAHEPEKAIDITERALEYFPEDSPHRVASEVNLALFRWDRYGDFDYRLEAQLGTLERVSERYPVQAVGQRRDIGMFHAWLGDWPNARAHLEQARDGEALNPAVGTEARAALAFLDGDLDTVAAARSTAANFADPYVADMTSMYEILLELQAGELERAGQTFATSPRQCFAASAYARVLAAQGDAAAATDLLDGQHASDRARRLYLSAARYLVTADEGDLDEFLAVTTAGARLLPGFIPIDALPQRAELAASYPIEDVLRSGRKDAIELRQADIPDLRLTLLGDVKVELLGASLELADRPKQILTLLALGATREQVAEAVWPGVDAKKQRNNLHVQLNALRKGIEPWGIPTYVFEDGLRRVASDFRELTAALAAGDAAAAYALYREPLAPGIEFASVDEERGRLHEEVVALLFEASGDTAAADATRYVDRVLELEPLHEEALQRYLRQLVRRGRRREARRRLDAFAEHLRADMDLEPLEETTRILEL